MKEFLFVTIALLANLPTFNNYWIAETTLDATYEYYMPLEYVNGIIYAMKRQDQAFHKLFYSEIIEEEILASPQELILISAVEFRNISPSAYLVQTGEFYFTASAEGRQILSVYKGQIKGLVVRDIEAVKLGDPKYIHLHPTFSTNGLRMIVSSNEEGGIDLYEYVRSDVDSDWMFVRNIEEINTTRTESFPNWVGDSILIYSRREGESSSSFNLYASTMLNENQRGPPSALTELNSEKDDIGILLINNNRGYFSSNRSGHDLLYYFSK